MSYRIHVEFGGFSRATNEMKSRGRWSIPEKKEDARTQEARRRIKAYYDRQEIVVFENYNFQGARWKIGHRGGPYYDLNITERLHQLTDWPNRQAAEAKLVQAIRESQVITFEPVTP